ncbi:MAG: AraC family transcriptional regulator [Blastocatellia bacterium]|nr:AraC family transcriptional regulator [Blastocatellia bacterium]
MRFGKYKFAASKTDAPVKLYHYNASMNKLPPVTTMYRALLNRDTTFEGIFYAGVKTTGIFCRPTCPAKKPKPENVEYFPSSKEALYGGYRPCARCHPLNKEKNLPEPLKLLREAIEQEPARKLSGLDLRSMGIEPSTARRQFQRYYGMTFNAYQRARRMGLALHEVRSGETVITAQLNTGFESASGFWAAFKQVFGSPPSRAAQVGCLSARWIETPLGPMLALANDEGLRLLEFVDRRGLEQEIAVLRKRAGCAIIPGDHPWLDKIDKELKSYFDGAVGGFTVPLVTTGSEFERSVWSLLRDIPPGETWSYTQLARALGSPNATRAVGRANGRNCLALVIPCHRVIRADGNLCGYGGGVWRKQWLLEHERRSVALAA